MPHSSDDPSSDRISAEAPSAQPPEGPESEPPSPSHPATPADDASIASDPQDRTADHRDAPRLPRRRRRRRRPPRAADPPGATLATQGQVEQPAAAPDAPQSGDLRAAPPPEGEPRRRRRRRRWPRRDAGSAEAVAGGAAQAAESAPESSPNVTAPNDVETPQNRPHEQPRSRRRRRRPPRPGEANAAEASKTGAGLGGTRARAPRHQSAPYSGSRSRGAPGRRSGDERPPERRSVGDGRRPSDHRARGKGSPRRNDGRQGRDRDAPRKKPEQRLYTLEAVVDRGFEDVVDAAEDNLTRRVHWTITKRTVADQESGKPISATYVLKRDGVDTEFPGLGAARAAVNKTIVHPEKLTLSKAEHAAEHAAEKK